jgi:5-methyltetrahydrofolate--homocysteine methyltransferase
VATEHLGEALPSMSPDLAPNCLALYLGGIGVEGDETVWVEPIIDDPSQVSFEYDADNVYWDFSWRLANDQIRLGGDKFLTSFPDLIEGLDTLAALRGTQELLFDLVDQPAWVTASLAQITTLYFVYYDKFYDLIKDERGGSIFWGWAPGRMSKLQCDISAMLSPSMFDAFMIPVLETMTAKLDYCMYHWDGPGAIPHHDSLLALDNLPMIQWTPGAAVEPVTHPRWWPLYHKTINAGKKMFLHVEEHEDLAAFKAEFGEKTKQFMLRMHVSSQERADEILSLTEVE